MSSNFGLCQSFVLYENLEHCARIYTPNLTQISFVKFVRNIDRLYILYLYIDYYIEPIFLALIDILKKIHEL